MEKKEPAVTEQEKKDEVKERIPVWLYPSTMAVMDGALERGNCKSRSEFLDQAALFYAGYLSGKDACAYLPPALVAAFKGTIRDSEGPPCPAALQTGGGSRYDDEYLGGRDGGERKHLERSAGAVRPRGAADRREHHLSGCSALPE